MARETQKLRSPPIFAADLSPAPRDEAGERAQAAERPEPAPEPSVAPEQVYLRPPRPPAEPMTWEPASRPTFAAAPGDAPARAAADLARRPKPGGRAGRMAANALVAGAVVLGPFAAIVAGTLAFGGVISLPRTGWSPTQAGAALFQGQWLGFSAGLQRMDAADAACTLLASGRLSRPQGFECGQKRYSRSILAFWANHETWTFRQRLGLTERHCLGRAAERLVIELTSDQVERVSVDCRPAPRP